MSWTPPKIAFKLLALSSSLLLCGTACHAMLHVPARPSTAAIPRVAFSQAAVLASAEMAPLDFVRNPRREFHLRMYHLHTHESIDVTYRVGNHYIPSALAMLDHFLRDHRTGAVANYDPHEFDVLNELMSKLHRPNGVIDIVCGYRSPWSNDYLRETTRGVAEHSQHIQGKAIDIRVPGVSTRRLDRVALSLQQGGVGYYPHSRFVHVDVGPVRRWTLM